MNMSVNIAGVEWKNPVTVASGTFGSGEEFSQYVDLNKLGAVTTKGVANVPWAGNPTPRVAEVYGGMMNAIGLQNPGIDLFCKRDIPNLRNYDTKIIVNVCGHAPEEYLAVVERLADEPVDMLEINISCPNVNAGFLAFGGAYRTDQKDREAAGDHETDPECNRHYRDRQRSRSRRSRCSFSDQYSDRHEDRYQPENFCTGQ